MAVRRRATRTRTRVKPPTRPGGGRQFTLSTRNARGVVANLFAADARAQRAIRKVVRRNGVQLHERAHAATPRRTGTMAALLRLRLSEGGLAYEVGWHEQDFTDAGLAFYPVYVIFGTRFMAANDFFFPLRDAQDQQLRDELRVELRRALARRGRA